MELKHLAEFVVLSEKCNFQESAEELFISLSSLSKHISKLEEELGVPLFDRTTRSVTLNKFGLVLQEYARNVVGMTDRCMRMLNEIRSGDMNRLSIGFKPMLGQYGLIETLSDFTKSHPGITLNMMENSQPTDLLLQGRCQFIFHAGYDPGEVDAMRVPYKVDNMVVVLPKGHPLAGEDRLTLEQLKDQPFIMHANASPEAIRFRKLCQDAGFEPKVATSISFTSTILKLIAKGMGIAVLNRIHTQNIDAMDVVIVDLFPYVPFYVHVLYQDRRSLTPAAEAFLHYIESLGVG